MWICGNRCISKLLSTIIYTSNNISVFPLPSLAVPFRHDSEQQQLTKISPLHQSFPFHAWICKCLWCAINRNTKQMQGNERSVSLCDFRSFPSADWERNFHLPINASPRNYLNSASGSAVLINFLLICVSCRVLPPCVKTEWLLYLEGNLHQQPDAHFVPKALTVQLSTPRSHFTTFHLTFCSWLSITFSIIFNKPKVGRP